MSEGRIPTEFTPGMTFHLPLWSRRPEEWLRREARKGLWSFNRGFRQIVPAEEDRLFADITPLLSYGVTVNDLVYSYAPRFAGYDPAGETRSGNAFVSAALTDRHRVITSMQLWRGSYKESAARVVGSYLREMHTLVHVENVALQGAILELIQDRCPDIPVAGFMTGRNKMDLKIGIPGLEAEIRNGVWALCMSDPYDTGSPLSEHDTDCMCAYHTFLQDLMSFPSPERTYDLLMAWWFCREAIRSAQTVPIVNAADDAGSIPADEVGGVFQY